MCYSTKSCTLRREMQIEDALFSSYRQLITQVHGFALPSQFILTAPGFWNEKVLTMYILGLQDTLNMISLKAGSCLPLVLPLLLF